MTARIRLLVLGTAAAVLSGAAVACSGPTTPTAFNKTIADTGGVFALSGGPASGPTAINTFVPIVARAVPTEHFDVAFDIRNDSAFALPPFRVNSTKSAALQLQTVPYDAITVAPTFGYNDTLPLPITANTVFLVQSASYGCVTQQVQSRRYIYSKIVIDSIHFYAYDPILAPAGRTIYYRMVVDPNCGFTSFAPGYPPS